MALFDCKKWRLDRQYARTSLAAPRVEPTAPLEPAPGVVYCFWTGDNPLTPNRLESLESMHRVIGIEVRLVTPENLPQYIVPGYPLHPAYEHLSLVHRSDYLRTYFMHHHGGGYSDIKRHSHSWEGLFEQMNDSDGWALGYREVASWGVVTLPGRVGRRIKRDWREIVGMGAFIFRPHTPLTQEWYDELHRRMDHYADALSLAPGNVMGDNAGYPIRWSGILGDIFFPLEHKYRDRLLMSDNVKPSFENYR